MNEGAPRTVELHRIVAGLRAPVAIVRVAGEDLTVVAVNEAMADELGDDPARLVGRPLEELPAAALLEAVRRLPAEALRAGRPLHREVGLEDRDQRVLDVTVIPLDVDDVLTVIHDLTGARRTAEALAETQAIARIGHWAWDIQADRISWTDELFRVFGIDPASWDATYDSYVRLIHPEDREEVKERIESAIRDATAYTVQHRIVRPDGTVRVVSSIGDVVTGRDGAPVRLAGAAQDITERVAAQEEAMRLREAHARHEQGLELNDNVMQGLAISRLALMEGDRARALDALDGAMEAVRAIIRSLLEARLGGAQALEAGDLVRKRGALEVGS